MLKKIKNKMPSSFSFVLSVAFHAAAVAFLSIEFSQHSDTLKTLLKNNEAKEITEATPLESVRLISKEEVRAIKARQIKQIVASQKSDVKEKPVGSRFLGESDNTVDRQTIARNHGSFKEAGLGRRDGASGELSQEKQEKIKKKTKKMSLSDLGGFKPSDVDANTYEMEENLAKITKDIALGLENGDITKSGLAANNDHVDDVSLGDMTSLNTQEYKYYGFYQRIRQQLEQHWGGSIKDKAKNLYRSGRRMPANENLITSVSVTINSSGKIIDMKIEGSSGIRELDQAAIESFNKAGPFPNPPKGLLVGGRATIQWGFVVKG